MFSCFQTGFQAGFQVIYSGKSGGIPNGNKLPLPTKTQKYVPRSYEITKFERLKRQAELLEASQREVEQDLVSQQIKIEEKELQRLRNLADKKLQMEIIELLAFQNEMLLKKSELQRQIAELRLEEEGIIVILLTMGI